MSGVTRGVNRHRAISDSLSATYLRRADGLAQLARNAPLLTTRVPGVGVEAGVGVRVRFRGPVGVRIRVKG